MHLLFVQNVFGRFHTVHNFFESLVVVVSVVFFFTCSFYRKHSSDKSDGYIKSRTLYKSYWILTVSSSHFWISNQKYQTELCFIYYDVVECKIVNEDCMWLVFNASDFVFTRCAYHFSHLHSPLKNRKKKKLSICGSVHTGSSSKCVIQMFESIMEKMQKSMQNRNTEKNHSQHHHNIELCKWAMWSVCTVEQCQYQKICNRAGSTKWLSVY